MSATGQRRRDGSTVDQGEGTAAAQQAGQGQGAPEQQTGIVTAAAALAATRAAAASAHAAGQAAQGTATTAALNVAAAGILAAFDRFYSQRRVDQNDYVTQTLDTEAPELSPEGRSDLSATEMAYEQAFAAKSRARVAAALPGILSIEDPAERKAALDALAAREKRFLEQREAAMANRTKGNVTQRDVEEKSPAGGFWKLDPDVKQHTPDCLAMGNKVWPHSVLRGYHPPLHGQCPCGIITPAQAEHEGLLTSRAQWATADQATPAMQVTESIVAGEADPILGVLNDVLEGYDARWGKGTTKAGQFRPKRGGDPGGVIIHDHLPHLPRVGRRGAEVEPVKRIGDDEANVRDINVGSLAEGDRVMVNGNLEHVTKVHGSTPGLVELEHSGLVHIDRDTIRGIKAPGADAGPGGTPHEAAGFASANEATKYMRELAPQQREARVEQYLTDGKIASEADRDDLVTAISQSMNCGGLLHGPRMAGLMKHAENAPLSQPAAPEDTHGGFKVGDKVSFRRPSIVNGNVEGYGPVEAHTVTGLQRNGYLHVGEPGAGFDVHHSDAHAVAEGEPPPTADFDPRGMQTGLADDATSSRDVMEIALRQAVKSKGETTLPGGIRIVAGAKPNVISGGKSRPQAFRVHGSDGQHVDVNGSGGAAIAALHFSANSSHPDTLGGSTRFDDFHDTGLTSEQADALNTVRELGNGREHVGYTVAGNPVTASTAQYRGKKSVKVGTERVIRPDGSSVELGTTNYHARNVPVGKVEQPEDARPAGAPKDLPPAGVPGVTGGDSAAAFKDVEDKLLNRKLGKAPKEAGPILPGFHAAQPGEKVSYKHEVVGQDLHVQNGFFRQGRDRREALVFRHIGKQLSDSLGPEGREQLAGKADSLGSEKGIQEAYFGINSDKTRDQFAAMHPDAAATVAQAALERGLPLHPEAAKLARNPAAIDSAPAEHPAHELARQLVGEKEGIWGDKLRQAGYSFSGSSRSPEGALQVHHVNHNAGATIITTHANGGPTDGDVTDAQAVISDPVPAGEASGILGQQGGGPLVEYMKSQGYPTYTTIPDNNGRWHEFVNADGRGRAVHELDSGKLDKVSAFVPTDDEVKRARVIQVQTDPLAHLKPGDDADAAYTTLDSSSGWIVGGPAPSGGFLATKAGDANTRIRVKATPNADGTHTITAIGHASIAPGGGDEIVTPAQHEAEVQAAKAQAERDAFEKKNATTETQAAVKAAVEAGDAKALHKALGQTSFAREGQYSMNDAVLHLRDQHKFIVNKKSTVGRRVQYQLRSPEGETVILRGASAYGGTGDVKFASPNPQGKVRTPLAAGEQPKNANALYVAALGRADELGQRLGARVNVEGIQQEGRSQRIAAHHEANGMIITSGSTHSGLDKYLKKRASGAEMTPAEHLHFYNDLETVQHEMNHGLGAPGDSYKGMAFNGAKHYQNGTISKAIEEALTEENGHTLTADWLKHMGMEDVLSHVKAHPDDSRVLGVYQDYRGPLKGILDNADIPVGERQALLERMKFTLTPEEQQAELARIAGTSNISQAWRAGGKRRVENEAGGVGFQPAMRPDLSDVPDAPVQVPKAKDGSTISVGQTVMVHGFGGVTEGEVVGIINTLSGPQLRISTPDGNTFTYGEAYIDSVVN